jgi:sporulation protein YlmC with PRC-barrel domain
MTGAGTTQHGSHALISADRVEGTAIYSPSGEKLGYVQDVMLHKETGRVAYAVVSVGGFLGIGEKYHPIPWSLLSYDIRKNGYVLPVDRRRLEEARSFAAEDVGDDDSAWRHEVHAHYNAPAYWM